MKTIGVLVGEPNPRVNRTGQQTVLLASLVAALLSDR